MRLTSRETEIMEILRKEPLIAQEELAARLGITRSSVAVHISNLMKKGIILGKGYVFNERVSCVVLGDTFFMVDVKPGKDGEAHIDVEMDGFGYVMSRNLARFGLDVKFVGLVGTDEEGGRLLSSLQKTGVDVAQVERPLDQRTSWVVRIDEENGPATYRQAFSEADYLRLVQAREWLVVNCEWLVVQHEYISLLVEVLAGRRDGARVCLGSCLSEQDLPGLPEDLSQLRLLVVGGEGPGEKVAADFSLIERGIKTLVVTDGQNSLWVNNPEASYVIPLPPGQDFDLKRGLQELTSGIIYGLGAGFPVRQAVRIGLGMVTRVETRE